MSTPPQYPQYPQQYPPQPPQYPVYPPPRPRNKALPWLIGGAVVVVAAIAVTLVLVLGGDDDDGGGGSDTASGGTSYDLSSPEKAAESLVAAAKAGDADAFLKLTCVGTPACVDKFGEDADPADVASMRDKIMNGLREFTSDMEGAEFGAATAASEPGVMEVPYETPDMVQGEHRGLTFIELNGRWLWYGSSGGGSAEGGGAGSEGGGGHPGDASVVPDSHEPTTTISCPPPESTDDGNPFPEHPPVEGCPR